MAEAVRHPRPVRYPRPARLPELVLITGSGRNSVTPGRSVVREAVASFLNSKKIRFAEPADNEGRLIVSADELRRHVERQTDENLGMRMMRHFSLRYIFAPSLLASILVVPKLLSFYGGS